MRSDTRDTSSRQQRQHASDDRYDQHVTSEQYRLERAAKAEVIFDLCDDELRSAIRIADLGAGTGIIRSILSQRIGQSIFGFELDTGFIVERSGMVSADVLHLPVADSSFEFLLINHLYEHVTSQPDLFAEAFRVLVPGGGAYVTAGNRLALIEPHYRLPLLSWFPRSIASRYLRASGRGKTYDDIHFLTYRPLVRIMKKSGFEIEDITERAIDQLIARTWGPQWARVWSIIGLIPEPVRRRLLCLASPQWFFIIRKPALDAVR